MTAASVTTVEPTQMFHIQSVGPSQNINPIGFAAVDWAPAGVNPNDRLDPAFVLLTSSQIQLTRGGNVLRLNAKISGFSTAGARQAPAIVLLKNGVLAQGNATGYIRVAGGHNLSTNNVDWEDSAPVAGDVYQILVIAEAGGGVVTSIAPWSNWTGRLEV